MREFDTDEALRAALKLFWAKGYDGTSLTDLASAMGIVRPSLQAAFGSKQDLYRKVLELYDREHMGFVVDALRQPTAVEMAKRYLEGFCATLREAGMPIGCLTIKGIVACGEEAQAARQEIVARQRGYERLIEQRLGSAQSEGDLPADADPKALAEFMTTVINGLAVRADGGASREDLLRASHLALKAFT